MFDPKITEGKWELEYDEPYKGPFSFSYLSLFVEREPENDCIVGSCGCCTGPFGDNIEDIKAIVAIPELLNIYKAAKKCLDSGDIKPGFDKDILSECIDKLEENHGGQ